VKEPNNGRDTAKEAKADIIHQNDVKDREKMMLDKMTRAVEAMQEKMINHSKSEPKMK
jgi:hypothetical protein